VEGAEGRWSTGSAVLDGESGRMTKILVLIGLFLMGLTESS
jgi:hypothetical protein